MRSLRNRLETDFPDPTENADKLKRRRSQIAAGLQIGQKAHLTEPQEKLLDMIRMMGDEGFPRDYIISTLRDLNLSLDDYRRMFDAGFIELDPINRTIKLKHGK